MYKYMKEAKSHFNGIKHAKINDLKVVYKYKILYIFDKTFASQ